MEPYICPSCGQELDYLDVIVNMQSGIVMYELFICHTEDCEDFGTIFHENNQDELVRGDPTGTY